MLRPSMRPAFETALPDIELAPVQVAETELEPPVDIFIHNDDVTPMDFVVAVLLHIFKLTTQDAQGVMLTAHYEGEAYVMTWPLEEAKYRVGKAHSTAREWGYPLRFTIETAQ